MPSSEKGSLALVVAGAAGRMGQAVIRAAAKAPGIVLLGGIEAKGHPALSQPHSDCPLTDDPLPVLARAAALIDFTAPQTSVELAGLAAQCRIVHVCGTTGFTPAQDKALDAAARHATLIQSGNMSLGVNLLAALVEQAAHALGPEFDVEILEMHHRRKVDAPSGTALLLGEAAAKGRGARPLGELRAAPYDGISGPRPQGSIGFASLRGGTVVGEHSVIFAGPGERVVLSHRAEDRAIFAEGALAAARWGLGRGPGRFSMRDVLGLNPAPSSGHG